MNKTGSIVIIDDDIDDRDILKEIFNDLGLPNEICFFNSGQTAFDYLRSAQSDPFIILSDLHLQEFDGLQLKEMMSRDMQISNKCVPLIFITTGTTRENLKRAYKMSVQGIFYKPPQYDQWKQLIKDIYEYWQTASMP
jgi:CheY-like chemotaxis protein